MGGDVARHEDEFATGTVLGRYRIEQVAGRGAMGVVYRAHQTHLERTVALKVIAGRFAEDPDFRARFELEARSAAQLSHPSIVPVHEAGEANGVLFLAMEWIEGMDLRRWLAVHGSLPPVDAIRVVGQIADALDVAHAADVLHRDVKPANVLVRPLRSGLHAYLTDFGVTRSLAEHADATSGLTGAGQLIGTPGFLSPEQISGASFDGRADIYALGCLLYEVLTAEPPFRRETQIATLMAHTSAARPLPSQAHPALGTAFDSIVSRAMAIDPAERYRDGHEMMAALSAAVSPTTRPRRRIQVAVPPMASSPPTTGSRRVITLADLALTDEC